MAILPIAWSRLKYSWRISEMQMCFDMASVELPIAASTLDKAIAVQRHELSGYQHQ